MTQGIGSLEPPLPPLGSIASPFVSMASSSSRAVPTLTRTTQQSPRVGLLTTPLVGEQRIECGFDLIGAVGLSATETRVLGLLAHYNLRAAHRTPPLVTTGPV
jgi:hypothetical protein